MLTDSHCHLHFPGLLDNIDEVLANMKHHQVSYALSVSVDLEGWPVLHNLVQKHPQLWASVGVHPDYEDCIEPDVETLVRLAQESKVVAIGETGLDYYRLQRPQEGEAQVGGTFENSMERQQQRFRNHIRAARATQKPLIIHTRAAGDDTLSILREEGAHTVGGVMHCFTESWSFAQAAIELGFYISLSGIVTFKNARDLQQVARQLPAERLLIETDSPYLAPVPLRGQVNQPAYLTHTAAYIAQLRGVDLAEIAALSTDNFFRLFADAKRPITI